MLFSVVRVSVIFRKLPNLHIVCFRILLVHRIWNQKQRCSSLMGSSHFKCLDTLKYLENPGVSCATGIDDLDEISFTLKPKKKNAHLIKNHFQQLQIVTSCLEINIYVEILIMRKHSTTLPNQIIINSIIISHLCSNYDRNCQHFSFIDFLFFIQMHTVVESLNP